MDFVLFLLLALVFMVPLVLRALLYYRREAPRGRLLLVSMALASLAGALLEFWQSFLPYRSADVLDWVADTVGALIAGALVALFWRTEPPPDARGASR